MSSDLQAVLQWPRMTAGVVHPWHLDQFGHMNVRHYASFFDDVSFLFWDSVCGGQGKMGQEFGAHTATIAATTEFAAELRSGDCFNVFAAVRKVGNKSVSLHFVMIGRSNNTCFATYETTEVFVNIASGSSVPIPQQLRQRLELFQSTGSDQGT